jgi:hypothetical protein
MPPPPPGSSAPPGRIDSQGLFVRQCYFQPSDNCALSAARPHSANLLAVRIAPRHINRSHPQTMMISCQALLRWRIFLLGPLPPPRADPQQWVQLLYLSLLGMVSNWVCFSKVLVPRAYAWVYPGRMSKGLVDLFLVTNVVSCLIFTNAVSRFGLMNCVRVGLVTMTAGCWLRCGFGVMIPPLGPCRRWRCPHPNNPTTMRGDDWGNGGAGLADCRGLFPPYPAMALGTTLVGLSQPFFQCTPPLLSATWFPLGERATRSAVALNFNQVGITTALLVEGWMVDKGGGGGGPGWQSHQQQQQQQCPCRHQRGWGRLQSRVASLHQSCLLGREGAEDGHCWGGGREQDDDHCRDD